MGQTMINISTATKADLTILNTRALSLKEGLNKTSTGKILSSQLNRIAEAIARQLDLEERIMDKIGIPLTTIHMAEHKKLQKDITQLEFSWKAKRISDEIYIKALNYKFEFHQHYFDEAQLALIDNK
jgi:hemerythrin